MIRLRVLTLDGGRRAELDPSRAVDAAILFDAADRIRRLTGELYR